VPALNQIDLHRLFLRETNANYAAALFWGSKTAYRNENGASHTERLREKKTGANRRPF
jgi:hypothetical protein